jgi:hypothetical protein
VGFRVFDQPLDIWRHRRRPNDGHPETLVLSEKRDSRRRSGQPPSVRDEAFTEGDDISGA